MIRFPCPRCHRPVKAPQEAAGARVVCGHCLECCTVPPPPPKAAQGSATAAVGDGASARAESLGALRDMRIWLRLAVALVAAVAALSLLLALAAPLLNLSEESVATARHDAAILVPSCLVILLALLYGQASSCPRCGKWWARTEGETDCVSREVFDRGGRPWVRSLRRINYACKFCRHIWSATSTDEYQGSARARPNGGR